MTRLIKKSDAVQEHVEMDANFLQLDDEIKIDEIVFNLIDNIGSKNIDSYNMGITDEIYQIVMTNNSFSGMSTPLLEIQKAVSSAVKEWILSHNN